MNAPKLQRILVAISDRLSQINTGDGYYTNAGQQVVRGQHSLDHTCLPGVSISLETRASRDALKRNAIVDATVVVEALAEIKAEPAEDVAVYMAADIQRALESDDRTLGGLLVADSAGGLTWQTDEIIYPEASETQVGVRVTYAIPHIRRPGDPIT